MAGKTPFRNCLRLITHTAYKDFFALSFFLLLSLPLLRLHLSSFLKTKTRLLLINVFLYYDGERRTDMNQIEGENDATAEIRENPQSLRLVSAN